MLIPNVIGTLKAVFGLARETNNVVATALASGAKWILRASGGVAGTDELQIWHDGTYGRLSAMDGVNGTVFADGSIDLLQLYRYAGVPQSKLPQNGHFSFSDLSGSAGPTQPPETGIRRVAAGVVGPGESGYLGSGWFQNTSGVSRVASDATNATATMSAITGLSSAVKAGRKYAGRMTLWVSDSVAADGVMVDFDGGTATWTSFRAAIVSQADGCTFGTTISAAIATDLTVPTLPDTNVHPLVVEFAGVVNAAGTLIPRFAQAAHTTGTATVHANSNLLLEDIP